MQCPKCGMELSLTPLGYFCHECSWNYILGSAEVILEESRESEV